MSLSGNQAELVEQIRALVERALVRQGQRTELRVEGTSLLVGRGAAGPRADVAGTIAQWENLPDDLREKRIAQIAQLLSPGPGAAPALARPKRRTSRPGWLSSLWTLAVVLLTAGALLIAYRYLAPGGAALGTLASTLHSAPSALAAPPLDADHERSLRASSACDLTRARVARGGNIGPSDVEGWVVEMVLLRRGGTEDLSASPALANLIARKPGSTSSTVIWPTAKSLASAKRFDAEVAVKPVAPFGASPMQGVSLVFSGPYVVPYFTEAERADYLMLADALVDALHVTDGALFARCAESEAHYIGSWFLGANAGGAVGSLIYNMADFSDAPLLKPSILGASSDSLRHAKAFDAIDGAARALDRSAAGILIGSELGMVSGRPNQPVRLTFPFRDANRATRASVTAARALKLANAG